MLADRGGVSRARGAVRSGAPAAQSGKSGLLRSSAQRPRRLAPHAGHIQRWMVIEQGATHHQTGRPLSSPGSVCKRVVSISIAGRKTQAESREALGLTTATSCMHAASQPQRNLNLVAKRVGTKNCNVVQIDWVGCLQNRPSLHLHSRRYRFVRQQRSLACARCGSPWQSRAASGRLPSALRSASSRP